jgi:hypothetical protein
MQHYTKNYHVIKQINMEITVKYWSVEQHQLILYVPIYLYYIGRKKATGGKVH